MYCGVLLVIASASLFQAIRDRIWFVLLVDTLKMESVQSVLRDTIAQQSLPCKLRVRALEYAQMEPIPQSLMLSPLLSALSNPKLQP
jgi:hypothetical protein